jgi:hypothetical protein
VCNFLIASLIVLTCACGSFNKREALEHLPSWIQGIRSGDESLRVVNGDRVFFRRLIAQKEEDAEELCSRVLALVQDDLNNESAQGIRLPFTLDYLLYDPSMRECAVTISVSSSLIGKVAEIKVMKEKHDEEKKELIRSYEEESKHRIELQAEIKKLQIFIANNKHLAEKVSLLQGKVESIRRTIASSREKAKSVFMTGMNVRQFKTVTGETPRISYTGSDLCYQSFKTFQHSPHGNVHVCWIGRFRQESIVGICDVRTKNCFTRDP